MDMYVGRNSILSSDKDGWLLIWRYRSIDRWMLQTKKEVRGKIRGSAETVKIHHTRWGAKHRFDAVVLSREISPFQAES